MAKRTTSRFDRAAIMRDAWKRFHDGQRRGFGWTFGRCLLVAWQAAKMRQRSPRQRYGLTGESPLAQIALA